MINPYSWWKLKFFKAYIKIGYEIFTCTVKTMRVRAHTLHSSCLTHSFVLEIVMSRPHVRYLSVSVALLYYNWYCQEHHDKKLKVSWTENSRTLLYHVLYEIVMSRPHVRYLSVSVALLYYNWYCQEHHDKKLKVSWTERSRQVQFFSFFQKFTIYMFCLFV